MTLEGLEAMAPRLAGLGWHLQLLTGLARLAPIRKRLAALPIECVIDHMALPRDEADLAGPGLDPLLALLGTGKAWVKLSAPYDGRADAPGSRPRPASRSGSTRLVRSACCSAPTGPTRRAIRCRRRRSGGLDRGGDRPASTGLPPPEPNSAARAPDRPAPAAEPRS